MLAAQTALPEGVSVGPGDDAAVLGPTGDPLVLSCDILVEDVHFRRGWLAVDEVGYRAAAAALSDLAAMAARPVGVLVAMALPDDVSPEEVHAGILEAAASVDAGVLGGDLSRSAGPIVVDVTVVGRAVSPGPVTRAGARPGDEVWVTGELGAAAAAVAIWEGGGTPSAALRRAFAHPSPRVVEALWLLERVPLHALIDLSDGLAGDAAHIAAASEVTLVLERRRIPVAGAVRSAFGDDGERAFTVATSGGEDYELCFIAPAGSVEKVAGRFAGSLTRVGTVVEAGDAPVLIEDDGRREPLEARGFDHFRPPRAAGELP